MQLQIFFVLRMQLQIFFVVTRVTVTPLSPCVAS